MLQGLIDEELGASEIQNGKSILKLQAFDCLFKFPPTFVLLSDTFGEKR